MNDDDAVMTERMRLAYRKWAFITPPTDADVAFDLWLGRIKLEAYEEGFFYGARQQSHETSN